MNPKISVILPTRGRTDMLERSLGGLIRNASDPKSIEVLLGFDTDDQESIKYFKENIAGIIDNYGATYNLYEFEPMGYNNLHRYVNGLAKVSSGDWMVFWNDDANMVDTGWDKTISSCKEFVIQCFDTHHLHPYSIFPIVPRQWHDILGYLSKHPLNDAYISQIGWVLGIMKRIDVKVDHDRFDLTGENKDETFDNRNLTPLEGNPNNPTDINYWKNRDIRHKDLNKLAKWLSTNGHDMTRWNKIVSGELDPWQLMREHDPNNQVTQTAIRSGV